MKHNNRVLAFCIFFDLWAFTNYLQAVVNRLGAHSTWKRVYDGVYNTISTVYIIDDFMQNATVNFLDEVIRQVIVFVDIYFL